MERAGAPASPSDSGESQLRQGGCHREGEELNSPEFCFHLGKSRGEEKQQGSLTKKGFCATEFSRIGPGPPSAAASPPWFRDEAQKGSLYRP